MTAPGSRPPAGAAVPPEGGPAPGRAEAREAAARELSGGEYRERTDWVGLAWEWLAERLEDVSVPGLGTGWAGPVFIALLLAVLVVVVLLVAGPLQRTAVRPQVPGAVFADVVLGAAEHRRRAEEAAADGRHALAVQERFRALVREAEERALLQERPGRTATEAAGELGGWLPELGGRLRAGARAFDDVRYGGHRADATAYAAMVALDEAVRTARPVLPATGAGAAPAGRDA